MGNLVYAYITNPDTSPDINNPPTFEPQRGFPRGRQIRHVEASQEDLDRANIPLDRRDYCADFYLKFLRCRERYFPRIAAYCAQEKHDYDKCEYEDFVLRMKEYEREKRMLEREKRIAEEEEDED